MASVLLPIQGQPSATAVRPISSSPNADALAEGRIFGRVNNNEVWLEEDVRALFPDAVIVREGQYKQQGGEFVVETSAVLPDKVFIESSGDWIEPVTPPPSVGKITIASDELKVVEVAGQVEVSDPGNPTIFRPAQEDSIILSGSTVKTGVDGTAAVFMGGVNSVRIAPGAETLINQKVEGAKRESLIDLKLGTVFSKVGRKPGEIQEFRVKGPSGVAAAKGTDFVTVQLPDRMDVWVAEGVVELLKPDGGVVGQVSAALDGGLKIIRSPVASSQEATAAANRQTMGAAIHFVSQVNLKTAALNERAKKGDTLSPEDQAYLKRLRRVTWLVEAKRVLPPTIP